MKKALKGIGIIAIILILLVGVMWITLNINMKLIRDTPIHEIDISEVNDQTVQGEYFFKNQIGAKVNVTVKDGEVVKIEIIEHLSGKGETAEIIVNDIIDSQSLLVDNIAGATTSSHIIKLAVMDALNNLK